MKARIDDSLRIRRARAGGGARRCVWGTAAAAAIALHSGCDFASPTETNPNTVPQATVDQLFTSIQVNTYLFTEGQMARLASMWLQQMAGTDRQFISYEGFILTEGDLDTEFSSIYTGGGLVDMRNAIAQAEEGGRRVYAGILKVHEAHLLGMAASIWGAIPYSEAANPENPTPVLDEQFAVYDAVQARLDEAIADLESGEQGPLGGPAGVDFSFGGDAASWVAVAHSLKARFHLHMAEVDPDRYALALEEAEQGIQTAAGDWRAQHSTAATENNLWHQFMRDRSGYISAGAFLVDLLQERNDPRLELYFTAGYDGYEGQFVGSPPGEPPGDPGQSASTLNVPGSPTYAQPIMTCAETQFIAAEAALMTAGEGAAAPFLAAGVACEEAHWDVTLPDPGPATLENVIREKYIANFLHMEVWNDYKRTCLPAVTPHPNGRPIPGRMFYGQQERQTNPNIPAPSAQPSRNPNDPNPC